MVTKSGPTCILRRKKGCIPNNEDSVIKSDTGHTSGRSVRRRPGTEVARNGETGAGRKISQLLPQVRIPKYGGAEIVSNSADRIIMLFSNQTKVKQKDHPPDTLSLSLGLYTYIDPKDIEMHPT